MSNPIFKLDLLEHHYLNKKTRFNKTRSILKSKKPHKLIPLDLELDQANDQITAVKSTIFDNKLHNALTKYQRELKKLVKSIKISKKVAEDEASFLKGLDIEKTSKIRVVKLLTKIYNQNSISKNKSDYKFITEWVLESILDKTNELNPSFYYNQLSNEEKNWYSKLINNKELKSVNETIESSFRLINGPVDKTKKTDKQVLEKEEKDIGSSSEDESDSDDEEDDEEDVDEDVEEDVEGSQQIADSDDDDEGIEKLYNEYDNLVAGSDDEDDDGVKLGDGINYNEVTDTEPSEDEDEVENEPESEDDFFEDSKPKEKKEKKDKKEKKEKKYKTEKEYNLPKLQDGYWSASDDDDEPQYDRLVEEITKPEKKNRRGQRARQKIWEQKYGNRANHVTKQKAEKQKQREQKQQEYEERQKKREEKARQATGGNQAPLGARTKRTDGSNIAPPIGPQPSQPQPLVEKVHPSWEAKLKQKEALKNVKFEGKKVKFD